MSSYDGCFYYKKLQGSLTMFLLIYVNDMLLACKDKSNSRGEDDSKVRISYDGS